MTGYSSSLRVCKVDALPRFVITAGTDNDSYIHPVLYSKAVAGGRLSTTANHRAGPAFLNSFLLLLRLPFLPPSYPFPIIIMTLSGQSSNV